jgi:hypothetical protein
MTAFERGSLQTTSVVIANEAKQSTPQQNEEWIASSLALLAMTRSAAHRNGDNDDLGRHPTKRRPA